MPVDPAYPQLNRRATQRMIDLAARLSDAELLTPVGEHWTVAIVYAHLAWWDRRVMYVLDKSARERKLFIPELDIFINDLSLPLWAAIPPREAVRIGLETAAELDQRLEVYDHALLREIYAYNPRWVVRALHRDQHLDEAEAALG